MKPRRRVNIEVRRPVAIAITIAAVAAVVLTGTVLASAAGRPTKQEILARVATAEAKAAAGPRAPKPPNAGQGLPPSSCPNPVQPGIFPAGEMPFHADGTFTTETEVVSSAGDPSLIYAGALRSDPQQGVLIVLREDRDPCKVRSGQAPAHDGLYMYPSPSRGGTLTLTQVVGDTVAFSAADGSHGSFNFVAGRYVSS